jgi:transcriptional regulator GlxA family with amidase domain
MVIMILILFGIIMALETFFTGEANKYSGLFSIFFTPLFIISWAVLIPRQIMNRRLEMELLYDKMKSYEGRGKGVSITDSSEEKLKRIIAFIDDNYISDISREGLAAAVDMNPGYMGGLFKSYTGKTINEYINSLRVEEAKRQLESGNTKIIDIAFSVGFENSVTFNRVFKKITGRTPSEYKEKLTAAR